MVVIKIHVKKAVRAMARVMCDDVDGRLRYKHLPADVKTRFALEIEGAIAIFRKTMTEEDDVYQEFFAGGEGDDEAAEWFGVGLGEMRQGRIGRFHRELSDVLTAKLQAYCKTIGYGDDAIALIEIPDKD